MMATREPPMTTACRMAPEPVKVLIAIVAVVTVPVVPVTVAPVIWPLANGLKCCGGTIA